MMNAHPQSRLILLVAILVMLAWLFLAGLVISMVCGMLNCSVLAKSAFLYSAAALVLSCVVALVPAALIKCPNCGEKMLKQTYKPQHARATRYPALDYWSSAVIDCVRKKQITCMYCGTPFSCDTAAMRTNLTGQPRNKK
jgi:DNA-directed RNA polymerase subunit RPC12/RpoP